MLLALLASCGEAELVEPPAEPPAALFRLAQDGEVQRWTADGETALLDTRSSVLTRGDATRKVRTHWPAWQTLSMCLGHPLALPPAGDPAGFRLLVWEDEVRWRVELSGTNTCQASGHVELDVSADVVDVDGLLVDGSPWREGGRERALELALQAFRATLLERWAELSDRERSEALLLLQHDPDPEAEAVLRALTELAGSRLSDIEAALSNRPEQGPASAR